MNWKSLAFLSLAGEGFDKIYSPRSEAFLGRNVFKKKLLYVFKELKERKCMNRGFGTRVANYRNKRREQKPSRIKNQRGEGK